MVLQSYKREIDIPDPIIHELVPTEAAKPGEKKEEKK